MIDHFPKDVILSFDYLIISAGVRNGRRLFNCVKLNELYPSSDIVISYSNYQDKEMLRKSYYDELKTTHSTIYLAFANPILMHHDILIICRENENIYIEILLDYIKELLGIECINLNDLFSKGNVGPLNLDWDSIKNKVVDMRRTYGSEMIKNMESTENGRLLLLEKMDLKAKIKKLKDIGIEVKKQDYDSIDQILREAWVEDSN